MASLGSKETFDGLRGKKSPIINPKPRGEGMTAADLFAREPPKGKEFKRVSKQLDDLLQDVKIDKDPPVGSRFWTTPPSLLCQVDITTRSKKARSDLPQNTKVYCAGAACWLDPPEQGTCRMPVTMMPPNSGKQPVYWVTYYEGKQVDPMKRFNLAPVEDELLYFRAWLAHKYGKMLRGSDGMADTTWWFKFYAFLDTDKSNSVSMEEFQVGLAKYCYPSKDGDEQLAYERRAALLNLLDENGDGELSFEEFGAVLGIDPKEIARKQREFNDQQKIDEVRNAVAENTFLDEDVYVLGADGIKRYSSQKAYNKWIRKRDNSSRKRYNNEAQRHTASIYKNTDMQKAFKKWYDWKYVKSEDELWAKHPKVWSSRMKISPHDMHPNFRDYFGKPGLFNGEKEIDAQMERDAEPPVRRIPMTEEFALLREHLCQLYSVDNLTDIDTQRRIFEMIDDNGNGQLSATEFTQALAHVVHYPPGPTTIDTRTRRGRIFHTLDYNAQGELDFDKLRKGLFEGPVGLAALYYKPQGMQPLGTA